MRSASTAPPRDPGNQRKHRSAPWLRVPLVKLDEGNQQDVEFCLWDWRCEWVRSRRDCRSIVRLARGRAMTVSIDSNVTSYRLADYDLAGQSLRLDRPFVRRQPGRPLCPTPSVH